METVKYSAVFAKTGDLVYISHLDVMTLFRRAIRRSGLPFVLTKGFTPRVKISLPQALKLGVESLCEEITICLSSEVAENEVMSKINDELPDGVVISRLERS